ncbi:MAG: glutamine synthetase III [Candidatus Wallbacteria bacterium]|nr:glutamine synthetase III [Candidatus Wallbacteria bacterium]
MPFASDSAADARFHAIREAGSRSPRCFRGEPDKSDSSRPISEIFGINTFNERVMREKLPGKVFRKLRQTIRRGEKLDMEIADSVAHAMKEWALERGVTHFCHWFQPQTGLTAEKHDSFLSFDDEGQAIERFSGSQLIQSEPDASSFPSGGMRSTFEARGYTAWDPSSPAFIVEGANGKVLCIPSAFISYHGEALDQKAPLLRSMEAVSQRAREILKLFGQKDPGRVTTTVGPEQEYFLIDRSFFHLRPDLMAAGRTLLGAKPPKGQELEDHYFGSIKDRVQAYMQEVEFELYRLGIPAKTRHNEVAPAQYEMAPIFEEANIAADHNQIAMEVMRRVALRHDFALLLHEKPFAGINGSGKHVNWSVQSAEGVNLLEPGDTPERNLQFLVFLVSVLKGVHKRGALIRSGVASAGNDHRLGANEAPPAIVSVFLGEQLTRILDAIERGENSQESTEKRILSLGIGKLPIISRDQTDRNRTSPFAFTGNKFEFRAVGAAFSISYPLAMLNAAVCEALEEIGSELKQRLKDGAPLNRAVMDVVKAAIVETKAVRFEGNNYAEEWVEEAERRGLPNLKTTPEALDVLTRADDKRLLKRLGIFSAEECEARYHVKMERYIKDLEIEVETVRDMAYTMVLPAAYRFQGELSNSVESAGRALAQLKLDARVSGSIKRQSDQLLGVLEQIGGLHESLESLDRAMDKAGRAKKVGEHGRLLAENVVPALAKVREHCDALEEKLPDGYWPLPKYREMLFIS